MKLKSFDIVYISFVLFFMIFSEAKVIANELFFKEDNPKAFLIDSIKIKRSFKIINDFESGIVNGSYANASVLEGVSMLEVIEDLRYMLNHPNSTKVGYLGHYCGPSAILNWYLNCCPDKYTKAVLDLAYKGKTKINPSSSILKVTKRVTKKVDYKCLKKYRNLNIRADIDSASISDFLLCSALENSEKSIQRVGLIWRGALINKSSLGSFIYSNTMPWEINDYFKKLGVQIESQSYYWGKKNTIEELKIIEVAVNKGKMPLIFDNHLISYAQTKNFIYKTIGAHFVTIHSLEVDEENDSVEYTYWDYGSVKGNPFKNEKGRSHSTGRLAKDMRILKRMQKKGIQRKVRKITIKEFISSMKGYWIPTN